MISALAGAAIALTIQARLAQSAQPAKNPESGEAIVQAATPVPSPTPTPSPATPPALSPSGSAPRQLNAEAKAELLAVAGNFQKVAVSCLKGDAEGYAFALQIKTFLADKGLPVSGVNEVTRSEPTVGQFAIERGTTVELLIGTNP
ncbi:MAG: hypothetical protein ACOYMS_08705 [Terrimicrobiaceae bacterium]